MALSAAQVWEVRTTGSDSNGGAFKAGASGTDYSQQDSAQIAFTDLAIDATANTKLTSAANPFTAAHVGNVVNITGGTGFTAGRYEITSVAASVATMDRAVGTTSSTGGTGNLGGCLASIVKAGTVAVPGNAVWVKASAVYTQTASASFSGVGTGSTSPVIATRIQGYATTRGDGGRASIVLSTNSGLFGLSVGTSFAEIANFDIDCASLSGSIGVSATSGAVIRNCRVRNFATRGIDLTASGQGNAAVEFCEVSGGMSAAQGAIYANTFGSIIMNSYVHDNSCHGITGNPATVYGNLIANNTGAAVDGINLASLGPLAIFQNTIYGSGRHGINIGVNAGAGCQAIKGNILANNGGYGIVFASSTGLPARWSVDGNVFYANTSGARSNGDDTTTNPQNGVSPYANTFDVPLTSTPFVNAGSADFRLNGTAGGGASCRGSSSINALPGLATNGYRDFGAIQHQDSGVTMITTFFEG